MNTILAVFKNSFKSEEVRQKILFTAFILIVFRIFAHITVPGVNTASLRNLFASNQFLGLLDIFSGGTLANFSVMALGLNPYIYASYIMQIVGFGFPRIAELAKEGEYGRQKINQYTRFLTIPLAMLQAVGIYLYLFRSHYVFNLSPIELVSFILTLTAGTLLLMWFGELITEYGVGNGISLLIFAGIVGRLPVFFSQTATSAATTNAINYVWIAVLGLVIVAATVFVNEGERKIPVFYAKRIKGNNVTGGQSTYLPFRVNQAGVMPIIYALSLVLLPSLIANALVGIKTAWLHNVGLWLLTVFNPFGVTYNVFFFLLIVGFTFFQTAISPYMNPKTIAEEMQKAGGFIQGIRPGAHTAKYLSYVITRITFAGSLFLGLIAVVPNIARAMTGMQNLLIGGTSVLIVVSVVLETVKAIEAQLVMRNYEKFLKR